MATFTCGHCQRQRTFETQELLCLAQFTCEGCGHWVSIPGKATNPTWGDYRSSVKLTPREAADPSVIAKIVRCKIEDVLAAGAMPSGGKGLRDRIAKEPPVRLSGTMTVTHKGITLVEDPTMPPGEFALTQISCQRCRQPIARGKLCATCLEAACMFTEEERCRIGEYARPVQAPLAEPERSYAALGWKYWHDRFVEESEKRMLLADRAQELEDRLGAVLIEKDRLEQRVRKLEKKR